MNKSNTIGKLAEALSKVQSEVQGAIKDSKNPFFGSKYADLESCWAALKEPLSKNGLSVAQTMGYIPDAGPTLVTTLMHVSGEWISGEQPICPKNLNPQELGSAITYSRRYGLSAITGLIQIDDDAEAAHGRGGQPGQDKKSDNKDKNPDQKPAGDYKPNGGGGRISEAQGKRLFAIKNKVGMPDDELKKLIKEIGGVESSKDLHYTKYNEIVKQVEAWQPSGEFTEDQIPF